MIKMNVTVRLYMYVNGAPQYVHDNGHVAEHNVPLRAHSSFQWHIGIRTTTREIAKEKKNTATVGINLPNRKFNGCYSSIEHIQH